MSARFLLLVETRNGVEVDLVVRGLRVHEHVPDFHLPRLPVFVVHLGDAFFPEREPGGRKDIPDTGLVLKLLLNRRRAGRQH